MHRIPVALLLILLAVALAGCGGGDPFSYVQVTGKVTYEDGARIPADQLMVTFLPQSAPLNDRTYPRPGIAEINSADGTFDTVTSHKYGDGIVPGRHKVTVQAFDAEMNPLGVVPAACADPAATPLEVDTEHGPHFEIRVPRP